MRLGHVTNVSKARNKVKEYVNVVIQLTESLDCDAEEIIDEVNKLNMIEYWVDNIMLDVCEDNDVMRKCLKESLGKFLSKYKI